MTLHHLRCQISNYDAKLNILSIM